jgi:hypothetical protein
MTRLTALVGGGRVNADHLAPVAVPAGGIRLVVQRVAVLAHRLRRANVRRDVTHGARQATLSVDGVRELRDWRLQARLRRSTRSGVAPTADQRLHLAVVALLTGRSFGELRTPVLVQRRVTVGARHATQNVRSVVEHFALEIDAPPFLPQVAADANVLTD